MRPGPPRGETAELEIVVTDDMADEETRDTPAVYGMSSMVRHMAVVCRQILEPHLEVGEVGVGDEVDIDCRIPVPVGSPVRLIATVAKVAPQQLVCEVLVRSGGLLAARGSYGLRVVEHQQFTDDVAERRGG